MQPDIGTIYPYIGVQFDIVPISGCIGDKQFQLLRANPQHTRTLHGLESKYSTWYVGKVRLFLTGLHWMEFVPAILLLAFCSYGVRVPYSTPAVSFTSLCCGDPFEVDDGRESRAFGEKISCVTSSRVHPSVKIA